jgi:hypothetical protein
MAQTLSEIAISEQSFEGQVQRSKILETEWREHSETGQWDN